MRSSLPLAAAAALALLLSCATRGTGPDSIEVGGQCDPSGDFNDCEETCLSNANMCVFRCAVDADCPVGSACTAIRFLDEGNSNICLPLCSTVPCAGYDQSLCCGSVARSSGIGMVDVCYVSYGGGFACRGY